MKNNEDNSPRIWMLTPIIGGTTEVWMYRQLMALTSEDCVVVTQEQQNPELFPILAENLHICPVDRTFTRTSRTINRLRNLRYGGFAGSPQERIWLSRLAIEFPPDVVFTQYGTTLRDYYPLLRRFNVPIVVQFNGFDLSRGVCETNHTFRHYRNWVKKNIANVHGIIVVAKYMEDWLIQHGVNPNRIRLIPYGVPTDEFTHTVNVSADACRFLSVGRFTEKKRPDLTIRAFAHCVRQSQDNLELRMIGDGQLYDKCRNLAAQLGVKDSITFLGSQPIEVVKTEMRNSSVFVQHSVTARDGDKEGWPVAVAEAAATGLPIVATRHAGITDQVDHAESGYLVQEGDWKQMGNSMAKLAASASLRLRMGERARAKMIALDVKKQTDRLRQFLRQVAEQKYRCGSR